MAEEVEEREYTPEQIQEQVKYAREDISCELKRSSNDFECDVEINYGWMAKEMGKIHENEIWADVEFAVIEPFSRYFSARETAIRCGIETKVSDKKVQDSLERLQGKHDRWNAVSLDRGIQEYVEALEKAATTG